MLSTVRRLAVPGNSSRIEAASRALVALVFLSALWFDPLEPVRTDLVGQALLLAFLAWSIALIVIAWRDWWWDHRLARIAHAIDIAVFVAAVYYTEAPSTDFASPFMAFAVLILIKARARWDRNATAWTALVLLVLNIAVAGTMAATGFPIDLYRFGRRAAYLVLLAVVLAWMGIERRVRLALPFPSLPPTTPPRFESVGPGGIGILPDPPLAAPMAAALRFAREATGASHAALAWAAAEEPWTELGSQDASGALVLTRLGPDALDLPGPAAGGAVANDCPMLFDATRRRALSFAPDGRRIALRLDSVPPLAAQCRVESGIAVPIISDAGTGQLLVWGIADPSFDRLTFACQAATEIGRAFEREERARLAQTIAVSGAVSHAVSGVREAVARDLHDSAAQFLAGTMFRLEALRRRIEADDAGTVADGGRTSPALAEEIVAIKDAMRLEQVQLRQLIGQLRRGETADIHVDLTPEIASLLGEIGTHWHLATTFEAPDAPIEVPVGLSHDVRQLVREGVANAARHAGGDAVCVALAVEDDWLDLTIADNGHGFPAGEHAVRPRSIAGRVAALGGTLAIGDARPHGTRLAIRLPRHHAGVANPVRDQAIAGLAAAPAP